MVANELVTFIRARLDEDEKRARKCDGDGEVEWIADDAIEHGLRAAGKHIDRHLPSRVLREVEALRAILDEHEIIDHTPDAGRPDSAFCKRCHWDRAYNPTGHPMPCDTVRALAPIWSDHRDYPGRPPEPEPIKVTGTFGYTSAMMVSPLPPGWPYARTE